jgi:hypothetical protein
MAFGRDPTKWPDWGLGQPRALSTDSGATLLLFYKLGTGEELVQSLSLADVGNPEFGRAAVVTAAGLPAPGTFHSADFAYDPSSDRVYATWDTGPMNTAPAGPNVQPDIAVGVLSRRELLSGGGSWTLLGRFGANLTGQQYNHNSGMVRDSLGGLPSLPELDVLFTVADPSIPHGHRGVFENRLWEAAGDVR